ncbi:MAG: glycoside hydrolase family 44 protein [Fibrobacteria bacterium]
MAAISLAAFASPALVSATVASTAVEYTVTPGLVRSAVAPLRTGRMTGTVLPIWNPPDIYARIRRGFGEQGFRLFRFPNGSLSNQYHWNGSGSYDATSIWHPDSATVTPGFQANTRYRGTTKSNYGSVFYSNLTDGVDSTLWWSDPLGGIDPWAAVDLGSARTLDSVSIVWGSLRPDSVEVGALTTEGWTLYVSTDLRFSARGAEAVTGSVTTLKLDGREIRYLAVLPHGVGAEGVQIGEIRAWSNGVKVTSNVADQAKQSRAWALSTHPGSKRSTEWGGTGTPNWTFANFMDYLKSMPGSEPMICVNYGTGTPEEAASWVRYANVKEGMGIRLWQIGNENDGEWEEGGPVTAKQYAGKYLAFARAMKAVDPSILILGPTLSTMEFSYAGSASFDGNTWTEEFLRLVGESETADGKRYLDGFDFHAYPYYPQGKPSPEDMLAAMRKLRPNLDTLSAMMARRLQDPGSRLISLSEFNASVVSMDLTMRPENATGMAMMLAQLIEKFGGSAMSIDWESYTAVGGNPDGSSGGTYGALALFIPPRSGAASSLDLAPNAPFWGNWMVSKAWAIDSAKPMEVGVAGGNLLEAFALTDGQDTSYLFQNLSAVPCSVQVDQSPTRGWIYSFSADQYAWNGTTASAYASPNSGPSSRPVPAGWTGKASVPGFGMIVVRTNSSTSLSAADHVVQMAVNNANLEFGDTLAISGTVIRSPDAAAPEARLGDSAFALSATDGAWDGPQEAFSVRIPAEDLGEGVRWLRLGAADSLHIAITGKARPTTRVDLFDDELLPSDQPSKMAWTAYIAGAPNTGLVYSFPARTGGGRAFMAKASLKQPANLGYRVYAESGLRLDRALVAASIGVKFDYASWHASGGAFNLQVTTDTVKNYDEYDLALPNTDSAWQTIRVKWSAFAQLGWGGVATGPLLARQINGLNFRAYGEGDTKFWIDNLVLLGASGDSISGIRRASVARDGWSVIPKGNLWAFDLPAGAKLRLISLDGREVYAFAARERELVGYRPRHAGILYAQVEIQGRRQVKMLPMIR